MAYEPYQFRSTFQSPKYYDSGGSSTNQLLQNLMAIQERKRQAARQAEMDRIAEEDRQREMQIEAEDRQIKLAQLAQAVAATQDRPTAKVKIKAPKAPETPVPAEPTAADSASYIQQQEAAPGVDMEVPSPTPTRQLSIGDLDMEIPLYSRSEVQQREEDAARRKIDLEVEKQVAINEATKTFTVPNDPAQFGEFAGLTLPITAVGALIRGQNPSTGTPQEVVIDGKPTLATAAEIAKAKAEGKSVTPYNKPTATGGGAVKWAWNTETNRSEPVSDEQLRNAPPGLYSDVTTGRKGSEESMVAGNLGTLISDSERRLDRYLGTLTGAGRYLPAQLSPQRYVAWDSYLNSLQSLGQLFGRAILKDQRVSDQDRAVYSGAIGSTNQIVNMLDPTEAKKRFQLLKDLVADYQRKYPEKGTFAPEPKPSAAGSSSTAGAPGAAPKQGDRKTAKNGMKLVFDGTGWVPEGQ